MILKLSKGLVYGLLTIVAIIILATTLVINVKINHYEGVEYSVTNIFSFIFFTAIPLLIILLIRKTNNKLNKKIKTILITAGIVCYIFVNIIWINKYKIELIDDAKIINDIAVQISEGNSNLKENEYLQFCVQQIGGTHFFAGIYKLFNTTDFKLIQYINMICNLMSMGMLYLIFRKLANKYIENEMLFFVILLTLFPLLLLSTYVYADYIGLFATLVSVYLLMKYAEKRRALYIIISAIFMGFAYFIKTNYLIFFIAGVIYLLLNFINSIKETDLKQKILQIFCIILFIIISVCPSVLFVKYIQKKYEWENKPYPTNMWIYMGMAENPYRANGWYNGDIDKIVLNNPEKGKQEYSKKIKERLSYFSSHPGYTVQFYLRKTVSMWAETTYQSVYYNMPTGIAREGEWEEVVEKSDGIYSSFCDGKIYNMLIYYGKAISIVIYAGVIIYVLRYGKQTDINIMYLMTIFIGGFLFHTIWEAKSRYALPYLIIIIPVGIIGISTKISIEMNKLKK